jgi:hypothetical protein
MNLFGASISPRTTLKAPAVPKPVLSDAVALKDRPGPEETALRWIGASVVAEQELVLA